jgi:geranylgeranyl pyrophosphate synthase
MSESLGKTLPTEDVELFLHETREAMRLGLERTPLASIVEETDSLLAQGKMLRSRLAFRVGQVNHVPRAHLMRASGAVEMIHAASLLHDDVIDGGYLRRGAPAFWVERGIPGAILLGDLMLFKALDMTTSINGGHLTQKLIELTGAVCEAESEQELVLRGETPTWDTCLGIARRKTGSLFAFAGYAAGGEDRELCRALEEAGFALGTAYQVSDDLLDAGGTEELSGKTLGTDQSRSKVTAARLEGAEAQRPAAFIEATCRKVMDLVAPWPASQEALAVFLREDLGPVLNRHVGCFSPSEP